jgi:hypothetical protein
MLPCGAFTAGGEANIFPENSLTFLDGGTFLASVKPTLTGGPYHDSCAQFSTASLGAGGYPLVAEYSGGNDLITFIINDPSTSGTLVEMVNPPPPPPLGDVSAPVSVTRDPLPGQRNATFQLITLHNTSGQTLHGPLYLILSGLGAKLRRATGLAPPKSSKW